MLLDEAKLIEKLRLIEALFAGATTEGRSRLNGLPFDVRMQQPVDR
jgi:hypothetical protein